MTKDTAVPDDELPEHLKTRPKNLRDWPLPTAWLLGTKLLGSLRDIILSSVVKVDLRTWMTAGEVVNPANLKPDPPDAPGTKPDPKPEPEPYYIDFLADTGDSQRLVFQLARLLQQKELEVWTWKHGDESKFPLPRGSVLVLGGDIAYPVSTHRRLLDRIRAPFKWAHDELDPAERKRLEATPVTLLAVPGNHDYYDGLRGFEAMFHAPPVHPFGPSPADKRKRCSHPSGGKPPSEQPLRLPGYKLAQHASYFAAVLPFDWHLWGLDIENHEIDDRQAAYFEWAKAWRPGVGQQKDAGEVSSIAPAPAPEKLIIVTSRPAFVYQGPSDHAEVIRRSMTRLGLTTAFDQNGVLEPKHVRLDLSGDVHLYERYWGTDAEPMPDDLDRVEAIGKKSKDQKKTMDGYEPPERYAPKEDKKNKRQLVNDHEARDGAPACTSYASVVSGLGGTFHHPSQVRMGTTPARATWPSAEHSAREIGIRLANPPQMFRAGAVGIVGLAVALACYFLIWESNTSFNVLDVPFALSSSLSNEQTDALRELGLVATMVLIVITMVGLPIGAYFLGRCLSTPIREMREPWSWWQRLTKFITHEAISGVLRLLGANARSSWMFLTNILPVGGTLAGWWLLYVWLRDLAANVESGKRIAGYTIITILVLTMAALGAFLAGKKNPLECWPENIGRRVILLVFGVIVALLVIWTPYAWVRLICRNHIFGAIGATIILLTMVFQLGRWFFPRSLRARRMTTAFGFVLLVAGALVWPLCFAYMDGTPVVNAHPMISLPLSALLGAYFACLWVGWYFCICLQWNAHGNEAGGAARITDYGEFLRIRLTRDEAEVWVIAVEETLKDEPRWYFPWVRRKVRTVEDSPPKARLIDHFTVNRSST